VLDIALDLGYSDHAHFTRAFRRWTGMPPREFRRMRNGERPSWLAPLAHGSGPTRAARS
jgi:AraC-like DNA-binding protein